MDKYSPIDNANNKYGGLKPKGGTRKIAGLKPVCRHPEHNPPGMRVFDDGVYEHVCPCCGNVQHFTVRNPTM